MGLNLSIYPLVDPSRLRGTASCLDRLSFDRDYRIFAQFSDAELRAGDTPEYPVGSIKCERIPSDCWLDINGKRTRKNGDQVVTFVYAEDAQRLMMPADTSQKNKAIKAFIDALPPDAPIILWWS
ncbi:MAG: hypothetical protein AAB590_01790 [Patescibacteria group bacterium]